MKKNNMNSLEGYRSLFLLVGLSTSLSFCLLAFEWKSYSKIKYDSWIPIDDYADTLELTPSITIPQPEPVFPKLQKKSNHIEPIDLAFDKMENLDFIEEMKNGSNNHDLNHDILDEFFDDDSMEELDALPFKPDISIPSIYPILTNNKCQKLSSNREQYICSIEMIKNRIKNQLYTPDYISGDIRFSVDFKIDTLGRVVHIEVIGTENTQIKNSAKKILSNLPLFTSPILNGEKRVMKNSIGVKIKNE